MMTDMYLRFASESIAAGAVLGCARDSMGSRGGAGRQDILAGGCVGGGGGWVGGVVGD